MAVTNIGIMIILIIVSVLGVFKNPTLVYLYKNRN